MTAPARTPARSPDATRAAILDAAERVLSRDPRAPMAAVAAQAGVSKGLPYHYFPSREALTEAVLERSLSALAERIAAMDLSGHPHAALHRFCREVLRLYEGRDDAHRLQALALDGLPAPAARRLRAHQRVAVAALSDVLRRCAPSAFANDSAGLRATAMSVFGMLNWFYMWAGPADRTARDAYARRVASLTLHGLRGERDA